MKKQCWINLPVEDIDRSIKFFTHLGFTVQQQHGSGQAELFIGDNNVLVMLFPKETFRNFTRNELVDTTKSTEVLFSIDAQSREEVDELSRKVTEAGGTIFSAPSNNQGWMYG
ncbi:VOC family protein, partial [Bacillus horti]